MIRVSILEHWLKIADTVPSLDDNEEVCIESQVGSNAVGADVRYS